MCQRRRILEAGIRAVHHVLMMAVVACPEAVAAIPEDWTTLQLGRFRRL